MNRKEKENRLTEKRTYKLTDKCAERKIKRKTERSVYQFSYILQPKLSDTELVFSLYFLFQEPNPKRPKPKPGELLQYMFVSLRG